MKKPTDAELLRIALEPDEEVEIDRVMRMSDDEIRASLVARGHDLRVLEAAAEVLWAQMHPKRKGRGGFLARSRRVHLGRCRGRRSHRVVLTLVVRAHYSKLTSVALPVVRSDSSGTISL
jgi:hypothetical protein